MGQEESGMSNGYSRDRMSNSRMDRDRDGRYSEDNFRYSEDRGRSYESYGYSRGNDMRSKLMDMAREAKNENERLAIMECVDKMR